MAKTRPFRFLDLSKELRLMVYERLPVKTKHHNFNMDDQQFFLFEEGEFCPSLALVHQTVPGFSILATCRLINSEAASVLGCVLSSIESAPVRFIPILDGINTERLQHQVMNCVSFSPRNCTAAKDPRNLVVIKNWAKHSKTHGSAKGRSAEKHVHIAIKEEPGKYTTGEFPEGVADEMMMSFFSFWEAVLKFVDRNMVSSVKVGENHVVLGYGRERPMY
jgi:hypothetical protein